MNKMTTREKLDHIAASLEALEGSIAQTEHKIQQLEERGTVRASEWWKDHKYLYLVHPSTGYGSDRKREYIGSNPAKIKEALERIERYNQVEHLRKHLKSLRALYGQANYNIDHALFALRGIQNRLPGVGDD